MTSMAEKQKILIVDDDANIAELIELYLTKECFQCMQAHDGEECIEEKCFLSTGSDPARYHASGH